MPVSSAFRKSTMELHGAVAPRAVEQVRARHQRLDRPDARPYRARQAASGRRRGDRMNRREFITLIGGAASWPGVTRAQRQPMLVIGYLRSGSRAASSQVEAAFRQGLSSMGFIEGRNVAIDYQYAENQNDRLMALTA